MTAKRLEDPVAKLKVMCARSMHVAVGALGQAFAQAAGHEIDFDFATVGALQAKLDAGETADVVILSVPGIDKLETFIALCTREGAPKPDFSTAEAFKRLLESAKAIATSDPAVGGSAGVHLAKTFEQQGLAAMMAGKSLPQQSGVEVAKRVVEGKAEFGLTLSGEVASVPGAVIAGAVPPPFGQDTVYCAAVMAASGAKAEASALIAALTAPATKPVWSKAGFELPS
jgi:molybdate transport system substrate-binding protein